MKLPHINLLLQLCQHPTLTIPANAARTFADTVDELIKEKQRLEDEAAKEVAQS